MPDTYGFECDFNNAHVVEDLPAPVMPAGWATGTIGISDGNGSQSTIQVVACPIEAAQLYAYMNSIAVTPLNLPPLPGS